MKIRLILVLSFLLSAAVFSQNNVAVITEKGTKYIPAYIREGTVYISLNDLADALSINNYYNKSNGKIELKFDDYLFKASTKNPYLIVTPRSTGISRIYQLPTSSFYIDEKIFIPLRYSVEPLQLAFGKAISFEKPNKMIIGKGVSVPKDDDWTYDNTNVPSETGYDINGITVTEKANGTLIRVQSKKRIPSYFSSFKDGILTIIFRKVNSDPFKTNRENLSGLIKKIETKNNGPDTEFKFEVGEDYSTNEVMNVQNSNDILITIHNKIFAKNETTEKYIDKWNFDVIVIDAGHGGKDPGAIGMGNLKEKDVNLAIALELGKLIESEMKDVKVVYTRKNDTFIDLYKRGKIANENNGNLFISIHCNSTKEKPTKSNGTEVYLLRPGRTEEAIEIAERENSVIEYEDNPNRYEKLTDENFILVSMAHSSYMKYSEKFAELLYKDFSDDLKLSSRGVKQAGFYVLVGASMPSVLIETGFISNKDDAAFLKSKKGQQQMAQSIFNGIKTYRSYYEKEMKAEL
jgi:N-acetylmuramoyl-L-alanine amidase